MLFKISHSFSIENLGIPSPWVIVLTALWLATNWHVSLADDIKERQEEVKDDQQKAKANPQKTENNHAESKSEKLFLDRLMMVESGGNVLAKNPRSSALGPYQFIRSTFLEVIHRNFPQVASDKTSAEILKLRIVPKVARRAALVYTRMNAVYLSKYGIRPEPGYLRLAFFVGPAGARSVITAKPETLVSKILSARAITANPFLRGVTSKQLIERSKREAAGLPLLPIRAARNDATIPPEIKLRCNLRRASCRKWLFLAKKRLARKLKSQ